MLTIDTIIGNVNDDPDLAAAFDDHESAGTLESITIDSADRVKSRLRTETDTGTDVGLVVDRPELRDGDVLVVDDDRMIVVTFSDREALVVSLPGELSTAEAIDLGHRIGNQHWDLAVADGDLYVPLAADRRIVENVVGKILPGCETRVESVDASLFVTDEHRHEHAHGHGHSHSHEHDHEGEHAHGGDDHEHSHEGQP